MTSDRIVETLTRSECDDLLAIRQVGRVVLSAAALPIAVPVAYSLVDGDVIFRPAADLAFGATGTVIAFEVDDFDVQTRVGWSVIATGIASVVTDADEIRALAEAQRPLVARCPRPALRTAVAGAGVRPPGACGTSRKRAEPRSSVPLRVTHVRREDRGLGPPLHPELGEQPGHVVLHGLLGQEQTLADLPVGEPLADELQGLALPLGQPHQRGRPRPAPPRSRSSTCAVTRGSSSEPPAGDRAHRVDEVVTADLLEDVARRRRP